MLHRKRKQKTLRPSERRDKLVEFTNMDPWGWKQLQARLKNHILHCKITYHTSNRRLLGTLNNQTLFILTLSWQHYVTYNASCISATMDELCHVGSMSEDSSGMGIRGRKNPHVFRRTVAHIILLQVNIIIINYVNNAQTPATRLTANYNKLDRNKSNIL